MKFYARIYENLCNRRKISPAENDFHVHHIIPKHTNGTDSEENLVRLTIKEHILAHFLLWKITHNINDLRAMYMLGAKLSKEQRKKTGEFCRDNNIGLFKASKQKRKEWALRGFETQKNKNGTDNFYYWSTPEGRKQRAKMGGIASFKSGNNKEFVFWMSKEGLKKRSSLGGKAHKGKKVMHKPGDKTFIRVNDIDISTYLNQGYVFGSPYSFNKGKKTNIPSTRRRKISDGNKTFNSVSEAALSYEVSSATIINWCRSEKKPNWGYVS